MDKMKYMLAGAAMLSAVSSTAITAKVEGVGDVVVPSPQVQHYLDLEVIAIVHFGLNTYANKEWGYGDTPASLFNPKKLDTDQWIRAAKAGGIKRVIMVCKHHDGFCLWPSKINKHYTVANSPWKGGKGDLVKEVRESTLKYGLEFAAYLSPWDRNHAEYARPAYTKYFHDQWNDLMDNYGPITEIWLDGANGGDGWYGGAKGVRKLPGGASAYYDFPKLLDTLFRKSKLAVVFGGGNPNPRQVTWPKNERGQVAEEYDFIRGGHYCPPEADTPMRTSGWFWHPHGGAKSLKDLTDRYFESVGRGGVLDLGLAPNKDGLLDDGDVRRLKEFGDYVRAFNKTDFLNQKGTKRSRGGDGMSWTFETPKPVTFNAVDIRENLAKGMRIKGWKVEADGKEIASGKLVANRRIRRFAPVTAKKIVFTVTACDGKPSIKGFALRHAPNVEKGETAAVKDEILKAKGTVAEPTTIKFDLGKAQEVSGFDYIPQSSLNGMVAGYKAETSADGKSWKVADEGEFGNLRANPIPQHIRFASVKARYVRVKATKAIEGSPVWKSEQIRLVK